MPVKLQEQSQSAVTVKKADWSQQSRRETVCASAKEKYRNGPPRTLRTTACELSEISFFGGEGRNSAMRNICSANWNTPSSHAAIQCPVRLLNLI